MKTTFIPIITAIIVLLNSMTPTAQAATIIVTSTADNGAGTLRAALAGAANGDTINFAVSLPATITLTTGELLVTNSLTIIGPGPNNLAVDGNAASRAFRIVSSLTVTISSLTITNGNAGFGDGGGIYNDHSTLTVSNCAVSGNTVGNVGGGGIINDGSGFGGSATLTVIASTLSGNSGGNAGGGIWNHGAFDGSATLTVSASTFSGNSAANGGGIFNGGNGGNAILTVSASTLSSNSAIFGGGIYNQEIASLTVSACTFRGNSAPSGGGIFQNTSLGGGDTLEIGDTILEAGASGVNILNGSGGGTVISDGYNLSSDAAGGDGTTGPGGFLNATGDIRNTDPLLGPLQNNGGPTFTHALLVGSPAIDQGKRDAIPALASDTDQRGLPRPVDFSGIANATGGDGSDIGAFEVQVVNRCPHSQGFWKNNPTLWPVSSLTLGSQTYTKAVLLAILKTSTTSDASLILARQLIAAKLNIANGSDPSPISSTIAHADGLLSGFGGKLPYKVSPASTTGKAMTKDANVLNSYNNGVLTPNCTP